MPDLNDQLRTYFDEIDPPFTPAELMREPRRNQHPRRIMTARAFTLAAGAAVAVLLVIGGPLLLLREADDVDVQPLAPVVVETTVTTVATTTTPSSSGEATPPVLITTDAARDIIDELHDAWNSGDIDVIRALLIPKAADDPGMMNRVVRAIDQLGAELTAECAEPTELAHGIAEIACSVSLLSDRFYTPAGVTWTRHVDYVVKPSGVDTRSGFFWSHGPTGYAYEFLRDFDTWLYERHQAGESFPGWIWVDPNNGLLPNWLDGQPCCLYPIDSLGAAERLPDLVDEYLEVPDDRWPATEIRMFEVREGAALRFGETCTDPARDIIGDPGGGAAAVEALDLIDTTVTLMDTEIVITYVFDTEAGIVTSAGALVPRQENYTIWLIDQDDNVLATLESYRPGSWGYTAGILSEDVGAHVHPEWGDGVSSDVRGDTIEQRWSRSKLEEELRDAGTHTDLDKVRWFVTTGGGMHGPEWFDRCPDNPNNN